MNWRIVLVTGLVLSMLPSVGRAQTGSHLIPTDHWSYHYVNRLRERGYLRQLNPLVQPYSRIEVARAMADVDVDSAPRNVRDWMALLQAEFGIELARVAGQEVPDWGGYVAGDTRGSTSQRLDPMRPLGDNGAWGRARVGVFGETGPLAGEVRITGDMYWNDDPDGIDPVQRLGGRTDHAYLSITAPFGWFAIGRMRQNWSALGTGGLLVSDEAFSYPQFNLNVGLGPVRLRSIIGELETLEGAKRWFAAHRLDYSKPNFTVSIGESVIQIPSSGGISLRYLNPLEAFNFDRDTEPTDQAVNVALDAQVWWRTGQFVFFGEGMLDDIDVRSSDGKEPTTYALTLGSRMPTVTQWLGVGLEYQRVSAWVYRTPNFNDQYSFLQRGLGANYSDYDRVTLTADVFLGVRGLELTPVLQYQRQGEGDFRDSIPPDPIYFASPTIFLGVKETTFRAGLRARYQPVRFLWIAVDVGESFIRNEQNVQGVNRSLFTAVGELGVQLDIPWRPGG